MKNWLMKVRQAVAEKVLRENQVARGYKGGYVSRSSSSFDNYIGSLKPFRVHLCPIRIFLHFNRLYYLLEIKKFIFVSEK